MPIREIEKLDALIPEHAHPIRDNRHRCLYRFGRVLCLEVLEPLESCPQPFFVEVANLLVEALPILECVDELSDLVVAKVLGANPEFEIGS